MIKEFTYQLPDEIYIDSFSQNKTINLKYEGPDLVQVLVNKTSGIISGVNPDNYNPDFFDLIDVSAEDNPEICYFLLNSSDNYEYEYVDEIMENGDVYKKVLNPTLQDCYELSFDLDKKIFNLNLITKKVEYDSFRLYLMSIRNKLNFILSNEEGKKEKGENLDVSEEMLSMVSEVSSSIDDLMNSDFVFMSWKYIDFDSAYKSLFPLSSEIKNLLENYQ